MVRNGVIVVTGPTASGKSALALALAERRPAKGAVVINADAMQTYDAFPILTAQPTAEERGRARHALYGVVPLIERLSAVRWCALATAEIERAHAAGLTPILCGGSGLYLRALIEGFAVIPDVPAALRDRANADWAELGPSDFRARLAKGDPVTVARLKPGDRQRHVRAWEVLEATGRPLGHWQNANASAAPKPWRFVTVLLNPPRPWLRERIEARFDAMLAAGVVAEVRSAFDRRPDPSSPGLKAHGAPELFSHFRGEISLARARQIAIDHTRQYAKRQMTWFRHQFIPDVVSEEASPQSLESLAQFLDKTGV